MCLQRSVLATLPLVLLGCPLLTAASPSLDDVRLEVRVNFNQLDANSDGRISRSEASAGITGITLAQFNALDANADRYIDREEAGVAVAPDAATPTQYTYAVLDSFPHDTDAFTQGLVMDDGVLYEGTGLRGQSSLRRVNLASGTVEQQADLSAVYFGEGITVWQDRIIQLTWQGRKGFVYDRETFALEREFRYDHEGWGITQDGTQLIMSDGTSRLRFLDPETFAVIRELNVVDGDTPVSRLNELESIQGEIWANVWQTDLIARIDPEDGHVTGWVNLAGLLTPTQASRADVLNGIAWDATTQRILVTGKRWPLIFHIAVEPAG